MDFVSALKYPYNSAAKVFTIVLVLTIAFALCLALLINTYDWSSYIDAIEISMTTGTSNTIEHAAFGAMALLGLLGLIAVAIVEGFWLSGYSVEVIRSVMAGQETLPEIEFGKNLREGFTLFLAGLLYGLLFFAYCIVVMLLRVILGEGIGGMLVMLAILVAIPVMFLMGWAYYIGMARLAVEADRSVVFQIAKNMRKARENVRPSISLIFYQIVLSLIYGIVRSIGDGILGGISGSDLMFGLTITLLIYLVVNLLQHFSFQHLIAQYAIKIGIGEYAEPDKDKVDFA